MNMPLQVSVRYSDQIAINKFCLKYNFDFFRNIAFKINIVENELEKAHLDRTFSLESKLYYPTKNTKKTTQSLKTKRKTKASEK